MTSSFRSFHIFYHGDRDRLLAQLVHPAVRALFAADRIDHFFFIRYALGGPHLRLRLRARPGQDAAVTEALEQAAAAFFREHPSTSSLAEEDIRKANRSILASDPAESDETVYPDNSLRELPFQPEIERYGGAALIERSFDMFALSSAEALRFLAAHGGEPRARQLPSIVRLLFDQAFGLAPDEDGLFTLLSYARAYWGSALEPVAARGDKLFEERREVFCRLLREELDALSPGSAPARPPPALAEAARRFAWEIRTADRPTSLRIGASHMHMSANRLGLSNAEEAYLGRLLFRMAEELKRQTPEVFQGLAARAGSPAEDAAPRLCDLLPGAFAALAAPAG